MFRQFIKQVGLDLDPNSIDQLENRSLVDQIVKLEKPELQEDQIIELYRYDVPKLGPDGTCSIHHEKEDKPYNLAEILGVDEDELSKHVQTERLWRLNQIITQLQKETKVDWLGIYRKIKKSKGEEVLVKEAYYGEISRPEFPLTEEFAKGSNNSTVGLSGKAIVVNNVSRYSGPYYECDAKVQSELCCPIFNDQNEIIGIIDAETFESEFFTSEKIALIAKVCYDLGKSNLLIS